MAEADRALPHRDALQAFKNTHRDMDVGVSTVLGQPGYYAKDRSGHTYQAGTVEGLRAQVDGPLVGFDDATQPRIARVYDYWLGGKTNFASDRELAAAIERLHPETPGMVRANRDFLRRAVRWVASQGISQFIDAGSGLPTIPTVHHMAREVTPAARVAYIDNEVMVVRHWQAQYTIHDLGLAAVAANLRYPAALLGEVALTNVIDLDRPVCVILALVLQFQEATAARKIATRFVQGIAPGSFVIISVPTGDPHLGAKVTDTYTAATIHNHSPETITGFLDGTDIQPPGVVDVQGWMPNGPLGSETPASCREAMVLGGVGRKAALDGAVPSEPDTAGEV